MSLSLGADWAKDFQVLWQDDERVIRRGRWVGEHGVVSSLVVVTPAAERGQPANLERLAHEYELREDLDPAWAARPLELRREGGRALLALEDPGGELLQQFVGAPMEMAQFLPLAAAIAAALGKAHQRGLVHKDIKPANIFVNCADGRARLTGFGIASRLAREGQAPAPSEFIVGALAYMAPEQTGLMNRSIDARSDLYALEVVFYQMITGRLPFGAADLMEWAHCHIATRPTPPVECVPTIPVAVSEIVMKLLAKTVEERYQTALGLEHDLRRCLAAWHALRSIEPFDFCERHTPDRLLMPEQQYGREREIGATVDQLDLATAVKVSQAASGEIILDKLIDTIMRAAIEQAGAERGVLVLAHNGEPRIAAEAATGGEAVLVDICDKPVTPDKLPETVLHYVTRTQEHALLSDAAGNSPFADDPYIRQRRARFILCLPLLIQAKLVGALYLENNLTPGVFAPVGIAILKLLASQTAIALENARLYRELAEREAKIRRLSRIEHHRDLHLGDSASRSGRRGRAIFCRGQRRVAAHVGTRARGIPIAPRATIGSDPAGVARPRRENTLGIARVGRRATV